MIEHDIIFQKERDGSPVKSLITDFKMVCLSFPAHPPLEAKDHAKIYVTVYGCADVHLVQRGLASISVYKNTECNISFEGNVKVHEKD